MKSDQNFEEQAVENSVWDEGCQFDSNDKFHTSCDNKHKEKRQKKRCDDEYPLENIVNNVEVLMSVVLPPYRALIFQACALKYLIR